MNRKSNETGGGNAGAPGKKEGVLEKLAQAVDPPGREISDEELLDPGANVPRSVPQGQDGKRTTGRR